MRLTFSITLLLSTITLFSQNQDLIDTQEWIKEKIELYGYTGDDIRYEYDIQFIDGHLMIFSKAVSSVLGDLSLIKAVPIKDLMQITFEEKQVNIHLVLKTRGSVNSIKVGQAELNSREYDKYYSTVSILLNKSLRSHNLEERLTRAFDHLIKLNGGKVVKERF